MPQNTSPDKSDTISIQTSKTSVTGDNEELITEEDPPKGCWHSFTKGVGGNSCLFLSTFGQSFPFFLSKCHFVDHSCLVYLFSHRHVDHKNYC